MPWRNAWITGASTGIGRQLALDLASSGVTVAVTARSADKLQELASHSPRIKPYPADVTNVSAIANTCSQIETDIGPIDLAVLNAGVWDAMKAKGYTAERAAATMSVNYGGLTTSLEALIPRMTERRAGHIAIVASVAGYRGLPKAVAYAPSKAAAISLAEVLHLDLAPHGIKVSLVNPGFVDTPMTAVNKFPMPFLLTVEDASQRILRGLRRGKFEVAFPWQLVAALKFGRILPYPAYFWLVRNFIAPNAEPDLQANGKSNGSGGKT